MAVIAMAMYAPQLSTLPFVDARTDSRYTSFRRSSQKQHDGTGYRGACMRDTFMQCEFVLLFVGLLWFPSVCSCKLVRKRSNISVIGHLRQQRKKRCTLYRFAVGPARGESCLGNCTRVTRGGRKSGESLSLHSCHITYNHYKSQVRTPRTPGPGPGQSQCGDAFPNQWCPPYPPMPPAKVI